MLDPWKVEIEMIVIQIAMWVQQTEPAFSQELLEAYFKISAGLPQTPSYLINHQSLFPWSKQEF